jgi:hypothetical protein
MRKIIWIVIAAICSSHAIAFDGINGISFNMTQKQVEAKGFVCNSLKEKNTNFIAQCEHMSMTGVIFGFPTNDYNVGIGSTKKVDRIGAYFNKGIGIADYLQIAVKIQTFFPEEEKEWSTASNSAVKVNQWKANDGTRARLTLISGVPPVRKTSLSIDFYSTRLMK